MPAASRAGHGLLLLVLLLGGCQTEMLTNVAENDANEMMALLQRHDISAAKTRQKDGRDTLSVEKTQFASAVELLHEAGFPRKTFESMGDVFQPSGLVASPMQERARFLWALGQELSRTISDIDGVLTARVQVVLPNNDLLNRDPTPSSASVFVRYDATSVVDRLVPQIKQLVANSVEGLSYDKVSVVMVPAVLPAPSPQPAPAAISQDGELAAGVGLGAGGAALLVAAWMATARLRHARVRRRRLVPEAAE